MAYGAGCCWRAHALVRNALCCQLNNTGPATCMPTDQPCAHDLANRRMVIGLLLSLLAHALILSIGFGLSGQHEGGARPITVSLAPLPPASPEHEPAPVAADAVPSLPPTPLSQRTPGSGFRVVDPVPMAPPPVAPQAQARPARRRRTPRPLLPPRETPSTPVIVQEDNPDAAFSVPLADERPEPVAPVPEVKEPEPLAAEAAPEPEPEEDAAGLARVEQQRAAEEEALRLAQAQAAERQRLAEDERVRAAERVQAQRLAGERALALQRQAQAEQEQARQREEMAARERQLAGEAEARRVQEEQLHRERDRQLRVARDEVRARELAAQRALAEEERRIAAAREAERQAVEQAAQRLAAEREQVARQRAEEVAREQARQLARQQEEEERTRRQRAEQVAAQEELARQQAIEQARRQAREAAEAERARQVAQGTGSGDPPGTAPGNGSGIGGTLPRATLGGAGLGGRARELLRGIELPGTPPAALRPAQQMAEGRRRVVDTLERDVPLRLYVDSFRQKIERNAAQIRMQVAGGPGRADPLVSVALRSDGSVDDVTIVRSSGRADLDEAVRRIVRLTARYAAFPPNVAARFDVIEIRRIWLFAETLKLLEEVR